MLETFDSDSQDAVPFLAGITLVVRVVDDEDIRVNTLDDDWEANHWIFEHNYNKIRLINVTLSFTFHSNLLCSK